MTTTPGAAPEQRAHSHYFKDITHLDWLDIYRVCALYITNDPSGALAHAAKKILVAGGRGAKDIRKDIQEAIDTLQRKLEMMHEDDQLKQPMHVGVDPGAGDDMTSFMILEAGGASTGGCVAFNVASEAMMDALIGGIGITRGGAWIDPRSIFDPHSELRKTWAPGQRWQASHDGFVWDNLSTTEPRWNPGLKYRRHPDDIDQPKPWYPDNSGDWVEVPDDCMVCPVGGDVEVCVLTRNTRAVKFSSEISGTAQHFHWQYPSAHGARIVAYRIIKKGKKND